MPNFPKSAFSKLQSLGYNLQYFHAVRGAHFGYLVSGGRKPLYAIRYKGRLVTDSTFRGAVAQLAARLGKPASTGY